MISLNQYSEDFDVLTKTIKLESDMNIKAGALILALGLKPMNIDELQRFISQDVGLSDEEAVELLGHASDVVEKLQS